MHALIDDCLLSDLNQLQQRILNAGLPVLVILEGSSGRVIGKVANELMRCLEPRGVVYNHFDPTDSGPMPILNFLQKTPCRGQIGLFDRSWYSSIIEIYGNEHKKKHLEAMLKESNDLERYLYLNGILIIKILLVASDNALADYGSQYGPQVPKKSFLSMDHIDPKKYKEAMLEAVFEESNTKYAPWSTVLVRDISETVSETVEKIMGMVNSRLQNGQEPFVTPDIKRPFNNPRKKLKREKTCPSFDELFAELSDEIGELQMELSLSDHSMIVCFEGWDAGGKGSSIKHLCHALNPRGYSVYQTKAPTEEELKHTYLWRFLKGIPQRGHITVYDRTWYGRMLVEPIEGFCTEDEYKRSPMEINAFEKMIVESKIIFVKIWLDITSEEQLKRFEKRKNDPLKQWKITEEDWRNRAKWNEYSEHIDVMIESTNTKYAPWTVIDANNKKYARIEVLRTVAEAMRKELKK
ncbi:MAG: hypothetical protein FWC44_03930 [Methanomassiliicoccaceae archaeon]|nr:hypothetical protein [Methanomassiliicoccaceae archaeon]